MKKQKYLNCEMPSFGRLLAIAFLFFSSNLTYAQAPSIDDLTYTQTPSIDYALEAEPEAGTVQTEPEQFDWEEPLPELRPPLPNIRIPSQVLLGRSPDGLPAPPAPAVIRAIVGFVAFLVLAYLAGHPRVQRLERRLNIAHPITAGLPFVILGFIASEPAVGILTPSVLSEVAPLLPLGLGWIGFAVGSRFDARALDRLPAGTGVAVVVTTAFPVAIIFTLTLLLLSAPVISWSGSGAVAFRDVLLLATAGAMAARSASHFLNGIRPGDPAPKKLINIIELEQLAGVFGLMMVSAYFRPQGEVTWQLPGTAWLFVTLGIGTTMGIVIFATLARINKGPQFTAALLGAVAFTAGMASFLRLSSVSVCFIAGVIVFNLGGLWRNHFRDVLERLERPVYYVFLVIAGALWRPWEWQGWALMALFVTSRFASKWLAAVVLRRFSVIDLTTSEWRALIGAPMGALSVAIVVSAQDLYSGPTVGWIVTAVIGGTIVMELALQIAARWIDPEIASGPPPAIQSGALPGTTG